MADPTRSPVVGRGASGLDGPISASTQLDQLLDNPRAPELVRSMPSVQLHRLVAAVGRGDASELLAMAAPEQLRELLDLEIWDGDRLSVDEGIDWMQTLMSLPSPIRRRTLRLLDVELVGALLLRRVRVHLIEDADDDWVPADAGGPLHRTPDGWFLLELLTEHPGEQQQLQALIEELYVDDHEETRRLLHSLVGEISDQLEETANRWRNGRLQDLGFADPDEALILYAYLDPRSVSPAERSADRPLRADPESSGRTDLCQILPSGDSFWNQAVARVEDPEERQRLAQALLAVSNRAIAADRVHPSDLAAASSSLEGLHDRLALGLEHLSGADLSRAPGVLAGVALLRVARVGHSLALELRRKLLPALREGRLGSAPGKLDRLDPPLSLQIAALVAPRPRRYTLEHETRCFHSLAALAEAEALIARTLAAVALVEAEGPARPWPARLTLGDLFRTAVSNRLLGRQGPLDADAVARLLDQQARGELRRLVAALVDEPRWVPLARPWVALWLGELEERLARLVAGALDLRQVDGLWVQR